MSGQDTIHTGGWGTIHMSGWGTIHMSGWGTDHNYMTPVGETLSIDSDRQIPMYLLGQCVWCISGFNDIENDAAIHHQIRLLHETAITIIIITHVHSFMKHYHNNTCTLLHEALP